MGWTFLAVSAAVFAGVIGLLVLVAVGGRWLTRDRARPFKAVVPTARVVKR